MQYVAQAVLVAKMREKSALWRLLLGLIVIVSIYLASIAALFGILTVISGWDGAQMWLIRMTRADSPTATLLVLATFIGMGLGPLIAARLLHGRPMSSLFGARGRLWRHFALAAAICAVIYAIGALLPSGAVPERNLPFGLWASFLPLALVAVLIQTGAEELLFRGYIQSQLAARFASPLVWMVIPSALFAVLHYQPEFFGDGAWMVVCAVFVFAMLAADLTAHTGTIGAAWGFHFANNCGALLIVGIEGPLSGLALFVLPEAALQPDQMARLVALDVAVMILVWAAIRGALWYRSARPVILAAR